MTENVLRTKIDQFLEIILTKGEAESGELQKRLGITKRTVESWADLLAREGLVEIEYRRIGRMIVKKADSEVKTTNLQQEELIDMRSEFEEKVKETIKPKTGELLRGKEKNKKPQIKTHTGLLGEKTQSPEKFVRKSGNKKQTKKRTARASGKLKVSGFIKKTSKKTKAKSDRKGKKASQKRAKEQKKRKIKKLPSKAVFRAKTGSKGRSV